MTAPASDVVRLDPAAFDWTSGAGGADEVRRISDAAAAADGHAPLNEDARLELRHSGLATAVGFLVPGAGFALVRGLSGPGRPELELAVDPERRGRGVGTALVDAVTATLDGIPLTAWSHGDHPAAASLAARAGWRAVRELWLMRRPADAALPDVPTPAGFAIRPYADADAGALLVVNAAAFADHPEQGSLDHDGLRRRTSEDWFDPAGLLLGERDGRVLGFHWTKVHPNGAGEVYVIGVHPDAQGTGLGRALLAAGLRHLGAREVVLYVEGANVGAIRLYGSFGFSHAASDTDVMYAVR